MVVAKKTKSSNKKKCNSCGVIKAIEHGYYKIAQEDLNFPDGYLNVCKKCYNESWEDKTLGFNNFIDFLRSANLPYIQDLYENAESLTNYIKIARIQTAYKDRRFKDSDRLFEPKGEIELKNKRLTELTEEEMEECIMFWGPGYNEKEYIFLLSEYADFERDYDLTGKPMKMLVSHLCMISLAIRKAMEEGRDAGQLHKQYNDKLHAANLKPAQEKAAVENEQNTWGNWVKKIENTMPIGEPLPEYRDPDGIVKYFRIFFTAQMMSSLGEEIPFREEYEEVMRQYELGLDDIDEEEVD